MFRVTKTDRLPGYRLKQSGGRADSELQAWNLSIKKWVLLHQFCRKGKMVEDGGRNTCGLCSLYFYGHEGECEECPIGEAGHTGCADTPCKEYESALEAGNLEGAYNAAAREITFLKELSHGTGL
jgi:hypothetical protein